MKMEGLCDDSIYNKVKSRTELLAVKVRRKCCLVLVNLRWGSLKQWQVVFWWFLCFLFLAADILRSSIQRKIRNHRRCWFISLALSCLSVSVCDCFRIDFSEILYLGVLLKCIDECRLWLKSEKFTIVHVYTRLCYPSTNRHSCDSV